MNRSPQRPGQAPSGDDGSLRRSPRNAKGTSDADTDARQAPKAEAVAYIPDPSLSRGEQIRAKIRHDLEQRKAAEAAAAARANGRPEEASSPEYDSDDAHPELPTLQSYTKKKKEAASPGKPSQSRSTRPRRQAAANRPRTYAIDPIDERSRLRKHPSGSERFLSPPSTSASAKELKTMLDRRYAMQVMLEERLKEQKGAAEGEGRFARADAIALELKREADAETDLALREHEDDAVDEAAEGGRDGLHALGDGDDDLLGESLYWSSNDSCSTCDSSSSTSASYASAREVPLVSSPSKHPSSKLMVDSGSSSPAPSAPLSAPSATSVADLPSEQAASPASISDAALDMGANAHMAIVDVLMSSVDDDYESKAILDIVKRDLDPEEELETSAKARVRKSFWRTCRVKRPQPDDVCPPEVARTDEAEHEQRQRLVLLLSGALPLLFTTLPAATSTPASLCTWLFFQWILSENLEVRQRSHEAFADIMQRHITDEAREGVIDAIASWLPRLFLLLGAKTATVCDCFSVRDDQLGTAPSASVAKKHREVELKDGLDKQRVGTAVTTAVAATAWLARAELWMILGRLMQAIRVISDSSHTQPKRSSDYAEGLFASLLLIRSELHYGHLRDEVGQTLTQLLVEFSPFSISNHMGGDVGVDCSKIWNVLRRESVEGRLEVLRAFPANNYIARTIRRWLAWRSLMGEDEVAAQRGLRYVIPELGRLAAIIDHADPHSPFYVSPPSEDRKADGQKTDYAALSATTELLSIALSDVALQICKPQGYVDTPGPTQSPLKRKDLASHSRALDLALAPYSFLEPKRRTKRIESLRGIVERLKQVQAEISDLNDATLERARVKDAMLRLYLALDYQITMYEARPHRWEEEGGGGAGGSKIGLAGKVPTALDRGMTQKMADTTTTGGTPLLVSGPSAGLGSGVATTPSLSSISTDSSYIGGAATTTEGKGSTSSLPRFARPESPTKQRMDRRRDKSCSSTLISTSTSSKKQKQVEGRTTSPSLEASSRPIDKRARSTSPSKTAKKSKLTASAATVVAGEGQRKLTSFFTGTARPEVIVSAPRSSSPTSLRGGKVKVDSDDLEGGGEDEEETTSSRTLLRSGDGSGSKRTTGEVRMPGPPPRRGAEVDGEGKGRLSTV